MVLVTLSCTDHDIRKYNVTLKISFTSPLKQGLISIMLKLKSEDLKIICHNFIIIKYILHTLLQNNYVDVLSM